jgi:hypothetical protein
MSNVVTFPGNRPSGGAYQYRRTTRKPYRRSEKSMHTVVFRSRESILQSDEAELVRDVRFDLDKAQRKLEKIRARIEGLQEYAATELQLLTDANTKLSAAIVAALLSTKERQ